MIRTDSGCTLAVMAITGRNQNASKTDLVCLLGSDSSSIQIVAVNATARAQHELGWAGHRTGQGHGVNGPQNTSAKCTKPMQHHTVYLQMFVGQWPEWRSGCKADMGHYRKCGTLNFGENKHVHVMFPPKGSTKARWLEWPESVLAPSGLWLDASFISHASLYIHICIHSL